jgi:hypothetical protein
MPRKCHYCDEGSDLRPYGPNGAFVCFSCTMGTPERKKEAEAQFVNQLLAIKGPALIGLEEGPVPVPNSQPLH